MLASVLLAHGIMPKEAMSEFLAIEPYNVRARGLDEQLTLHEFGRALVHMNQRRGFKSNRKSDKKKDDGVVAQKTGELQKLIEDKECRTLGEYLAQLDPAEERIRGRYILRSMVEHEFDLLWAEQAKHHEELTDDLKKKIRDGIIFFQRPLKSVAHLIGPCSLEPDKRRAKKESLEFQHYRILEQVNRISLIDEDGVFTPFSRLSVEDFEPDVIEMRDKLIKELFTREDLKFDRMRKVLNLPETTRINLEMDGDSKLKGNTTTTKLARIFGKAWHKLPDEEKEKYLQTLSIAEDHDWLVQHAMDKWGLSEEKAEKLSAVSLEPGYAHYSIKAIRKLIPHLEQGLSLAEAKAAAGYEPSQGDLDFTTFMENLRNPIVKQTLHELSGLMHALVEVYGAPESIRVELARDLKASAKRRDEMLWENRERKKANDDVRQRLEEMRIRPTGDAVLRYKLWDECKGVCPYTGTQISIKDLFSDSPTYQVEHIIPYPRSLDDSFMNKTLCHIRENQRKGNQTPYELYGGTEQYEEVKARAKRLPFGKYKRFLQKELDDNFISRQLNDTAYISRMARQLLEGMGYQVGVSKGQAAATLRRLWGLNSLLGDPTTAEVKSRDDHRHHAIDAAVVAATTQGTLQALSTYNKYGRDPRKERFPEPWEGFRHALAPHVSGLLVSHRVSKRARGQLHNESLYGVTGLKDKSGKPLYAIRKPIETLTAPMVGRIADPVVQDVVKGHLRALGVEPEGKFTLPKDAFKGVELRMPSGVAIKKVRLHESSSNMYVLPSSGKTGVEPGGNHHMVIFSYTNANGQRMQGGTVCALIEAAGRKSKGQPIIQRDLGDNREFMFSLAINELVVVYNEKPEEIDWNDKAALGERLYRVQMISANQLVFRHHTVSIVKDEDGNKGIGRLIRNPSTLKAFKVRIDRIGRIFVAND
jgi:CRISPR-associated endonuclease Csn1